MASTFLAALALMWQQPDSITMGGTMGALIDNADVRSVTVETGSETITLVKSSSGSGMIRSSWQSRRSIGMSA